MRQILLLLLSTALLCATSALGYGSESDAGEGAAVDEVEQGDEAVAPARERLVDEMATGFIRAIRKESAVWWECGEETPKDEWKNRAETMARNLLDALDEYDVAVSPWGPWGVIWSESRGNRCSIGPNPRKYARKAGIIDAPMNPHLWTEDKVRNVLGDPKWRRRTADLSIGQVVWRKYARLPCEEGEDGCRRENRKWVRVPTLDEMLSVEGGAKVTAYGMAERVRWSGGRTKIPWIYWPGNRADYTYARRIAGVVRDMGGPHREVLGYMR